MHFISSGTLSSTHLIKRSPSDSPAPSSVPVPPSSGASAILSTSGSSSVNQAASSPAVQSVGASRVERRSPRLAAVVAAAVPAADAVSGELVDVEAFTNGSLVVVVSIFMSSASRRSELELVAVFPPSGSPSLLAEVDTSLSLSPTALIRL